MAKAVGVAVVREEDLLERRLLRSERGDVGIADRGEHAPAVSR